MSDTLKIGNGSAPVMLDEPIIFASGDNNQWYYTDTDIGIGSVNGFHFRTEVEEVFKISPERRIYHDDKDITDDDAALADAFRQWAEILYPNPEGKNDGR